MSSPAPGRDRIPPQWGGPLTENDYTTLAASWITPEIAAQTMLRRVDARRGREILGQKGNRDCGGILIPYYLPGETSPHTYRLRLDHPEMRQGKDGKAKPVGKYLAPRGDRNRLYVPPGVTLEQLYDITIPIVIVEGEKKALALWRLANEGVDVPRFIPIAIPGVWSWRGKIGKTPGPNGESLDVRGPIADLARVTWKGRKVFIVFDSNVHTNDQVKWARTGLSRHLATCEAEVKLVNLPKDCGVNGIDDLLALRGSKEVLTLFDSAVSGARLEIQLPPQYQSKPEGIFRVTGSGERLSQTQLTTFRGAIVTNIQLDDGVEAKREFEIEAELHGRTTRFTISASEFLQMNWPIERLGAAAIIYPNLREYAKTAIQSLSVTATEKCIYAHTGWRKVGDQWIFLHAGGAIGAAGTVPDVNVRLFGALSRYDLSPPPNPSALKDAVKASLRLVELGPRSMSFPLLAATFRAVFGDADFSLHLVGETGAFKSELAALHQQFFGPAMNRVNLPGAWSSTGNALEALAFYAKDALFVIDDFAPQGGTVDVARYHAAADRVFRAAGNHAGRGRLDSTARLREPKPPRALILSTGEEIPRGQSVRARLLILEISKGSFNGGELAACQRDALAGLYAMSMAGFLQWLAGRDQARAAFNQKLSEYRSKALLKSTHARTPDILASLQAAFELYLEFCVHSGAIDVAEGGRLGERCWGALCEAAESQAKHQTETEPTVRFLNLLRSLLSSGRAHLAARAGGEPDRAPGSCGWRRDSSGNWMPLGERIGWVERDDVYLEPTAAFRAVQVAARDSGESFAISEPTLRKRLRDKDLLASVDEKHETLTVRRKIGGSSKGVLNLRRRTVLPEAAEDGTDDGE